MNEQSRIHEQSWDDFADDPPTEIAALDVPGRGSIWTDALLVVLTLSFLLAGLISCDPENYE
jgi:hypothetical protein